MTREEQARQMQGIVAGIAQGARARVSDLQRALNDCMSAGEKVSPEVATEVKAIQSATESFAAKCSASASRLEIFTIEMGDVTGDYAHLS